MPCKDSSSMMSDEIIPSFARMSKCMALDQMMLRPLRIFDGPFLFDRLKDTDMLSSGGTGAPVSAFWYPVWWRFKKHFNLSYIIELDSLRIGFIGLYDLRLRESAEMALLIFDVNLRNRGHGSRAFRLFSDNLDDRFVKKITVRVMRGNNIAISFWSRLGFEKVKDEDSFITMSLQLH